MKKLLLFRVIIFCAISILISGCSSLGGKQPFQMYSYRTDCVSCKKMDKWGFMKKNIYRDGKYGYIEFYYSAYDEEMFNSNIRKPLSHWQLGSLGNCYGTALDTIKLGATHFRILDKEKWGDWQDYHMPASISPSLLGYTAVSYTHLTLPTNREV